MKAEDAVKPLPKRTAESTRDEMIRELKHLRTVIREAGENFILRREGEVEAIIANLSSVPAVRLKREGPQWLRSLRSHGAKPAKGRLRDLRELSALIDDLADEVVAAQTPEKNHPARTKE